MVFYVHAAIDSFSRVLLSAVLFFFLFFFYKITFYGFVSGISS